MSAVIGVVSVSISVVRGGGGLLLSIISVVLMSELLSFIEIGGELSEVITVHSLVSLVNIRS